LEIGPARTDATTALKQKKAPTVGEGDMLRVTIELLPMGGTKGRKHLGHVHIINVEGNAAYASYQIDVFDDAGKKIATGNLADYPRFAATVWDLAARGIATALAGQEELPPRPAHIRS
jgi:hypothetical protein